MNLLGFFVPLSCLIWLTVAQIMQTRYMWAQSHTLRHEWHISRRYAIIGVLLAIVCSVNGYVNIERANVHAGLIEAGYQVVRVHVFPGYPTSAVLRDCSGDRLTLPWRNPSGSYDVYPYTDPPFAEAPLHPPRWSWPDRRTICMNEANEVTPVSYRQS